MRSLPCLILFAIAACGGSAGDTTTPTQSSGPRCAQPLVSSTTIPSGTLPAVGGCAVLTRYTGEIAVRGSTAYTTTALNRIDRGNAVFIWDVSGNTPLLVDSLITGPTVSDVGDVEVSDDGKVMVVGTEYAPGTMIVYDLADPRHPRELSRFTNDLTSPGVHTAKLGRVNGTLYAFIGVYPSPGGPRIIIVDLSNPSSPRQVYTTQVGTPWMHDTFIRDGYLFVALWTDGFQIWDIGGGGNGSPSTPRVIGGTTTVGGGDHNLYWYRDASGKRYVFVGQEGAGTIGSTSHGDIHVVDVGDMTKPREVAFLHVSDNAGPHNFAVDENTGLLYSAYYNGGIQVLDIRGDLGSCTAEQQVTANGVTRCDLMAMGRRYATGLLDQGRPVYVWGVQLSGGYLYASDMLNGIWKLRAISR
jgi:hypothetical protein